METPSCTRCGSVKPANEFVRPEVTGKIKQFRTCNDCYKNSTECKNAKKRQLETEEIDDIKVSNIRSKISRKLYHSILRINNKKKEKD
ncbi:hypothetical protein F8M41_019050 [Gigaspora margarita]|uniref:Uncharacterized protein n=1 Tax=Gigaspora margarita TaxID=4874 RepID=A0A8H4EKV8_GIGMA|nr:hypothetical protein F8M41_019050 [Gigaspora margarita]